MHGSLARLLQDTVVASSDQHTASGVMTKVHVSAASRKAYTRKKILRLHTSLRELTAAALAGVPPEEVALQQPPEEDEPSDPLVLPGRMKRTSQARKNKAAAQQAARQADSSAGAAAEQAAQQPAAQAVV